MTEPAIIGRVVATETEFMGTTAYLLKHVPAAVGTIIIKAKIRGDDLPFPLAAVTMDAAVNSGPRRAVEWLQKALGVTADGQLGPVTMHAAGNAADPKKTAARACRHRIQYLAGLQGFAQWSASWLQRTLDVFRLGVEGQP